MFHVCEFSVVDGNLIFKKNIFELFNFFFVNLGKEQNRDA